MRADSSYFFCVENKGIFIRCLSKYDEAESKSIYNFLFYSQFVNRKVVYLPKLNEGPASENGKSFRIYGSNGQKLISMTSRKHRLL